VLLRGAEPDFRLNADREEEDRTWAASSSTHNWISRRRGDHLNSGTTPACLKPTLTSPCREIIKMRFALRMASEHTL